MALILNVRGTSPSVGSGGCERQRVLFRPTRWRPQSPVPAGVAACRSERDRADRRTLDSTRVRGRLLRRDGTVRWLTGLLVFVLAAAWGGAAEVIPPAPRDHFNDYAGMVRRETAARLNTELAQFERDTSNQIVVALFPHMQSESSVEDYTVRVAQRWGVGQRDRRNGAVLFVFQDTHDIRIVTGYGLEGALPDARCKQIIENEIIPRFRAGDFDGGISAGVAAMIASAKGEYQGTGRTTAEARGTSGGRGGSFLFLLFAFLMFWMFSRAARRNVVYGRRGRTVMWGGPWGGWGGGGGGGWSGGSGGGTFSGGGGSFGGGGAGGRW